VSTNWRDPKKEDYKLPSTENELSKVRQTIEHKSSFWSFNKKVVLRTILIGVNILLILFVIVEYTQRDFTGVSNERKRLSRENDSLKSENYRLNSELMHYRQRPSERTVRAPNDSSPVSEPNFIVFLASAEENKVDDIIKEADQLQKVTKEKLYVYSLKLKKKIVAIGTESIRDSLIANSRAKKLELDIGKKPLTLRFNEDNKVLYDASRRKRY